MAPKTIDDGIYFFENVATGTVMDLDWGNSADRTKVQGWQKRALSDPLVSCQLWVVSYYGNDEYTIQNTNSRTYLDLTAGSFQNATPLIGHQWNGGTNQRWYIKRTNDKTAYVISSVGAGTFLDLLNGNGECGTPIMGWHGLGPSTTNEHQIWYINRA